MNVRTPRVWESLSSSQRKRIEEYCRGVALEAARETTERDGRIMLDIYIKMVCLTLHEVFGFGEKRLTLFLGNHRALFFDQKKKVEDGTQLDYLNAKMAKIFKKNGFPQDFFDKMLGAVEPVPEEG
jgi:hypothetical protein